VKIILAVVIRMTTNVRELYGPKLPIFRAIGVIFISRLLQPDLPDCNSPSLNDLAREAMIAQSDP
jgi:hypothetical protein